MPLFEKITDPKMLSDLDKVELPASLSLTLVNPPFISRIKLKSPDDKTPLDTLHLECIIRAHEYQFRTFIFETPASTKRKLIESPVPSPLTKIGLDDGTIILVGPTLLAIDSGAVRLKLSWTESQTELPLQEIISFLN